MISAEFFTLPDGRLAGFHIRGHAGWGEEGTDIVCAAVSSAAYMAANTITEILAVQPLALKADEGEMLLQLHEQDEPLCRTLLQGLRLHVSGLAEQYPAYITVSDSMISNPHNL